MKRLTLLLAGMSLAMTAQAGGDVLSHVPTSAKQFVYYPAPAASAKKFLALASRFSDKNAKDGFVGSAHRSRWGLDLDAQEGPVLLAEVPGSGAEAAHLLFLAPAQPESLLTALKAQKGKDGWTYRLPAKGKKAGALRHVALRDGVLVLATEQEALAPEKLEDLSVLRSWMGNVDMMAGLPRLVLAQGLNKAALGIGMLKSMPDQPQPKAEGEEGQANADQMAAGLKAIKPAIAQIEPLVVKLQESADLAAVAVSLQPEGLKVKAEVFFKPGSPMTRPAFTAEGATALQGIPGQDFVLAMGMNGSALAPLQGLGNAVMEGMLGGKADPEVLKRWQALNASTAASLRNMAFSLALPSRPGAPLLSGSVGVLKVQDAGAYLKDMAEAQGLGVQLMKSLGEGAKPGFTPEIKRDLLPEVPSLGMTFDLNALGTLPPQAAMGLGLVFGGQQVKVAYGALDGQTLVGVLGDGEALKEALARVRTTRPLEQTTAIQAALGTLPKGGFFQFCFSPKGLGEAVRTVVTQFGGPKMPELPALKGDLMAASCFWNAGGLGMEAVAPDAALNDMAALVKVFDAMSAKKPKGEAGEDATPKARPRKKAKG